MFCQWLHMTTSIEEKASDFVWEVKVKSKLKERGIQVRAITLGLARRPSFSKIPRPLATRIENTTSSLAPADAIAAAQARRSSMSSTLAFAITTWHRSGKRQLESAVVVSMDTLSLCMLISACVCFFSEIQSRPEGEEGGFLLLYGSFRTGSLHFLFFYFTLLSKE